VGKYFLDLIDRFVQSESRHRAIMVVSFWRKFTALLLLVVVVSFRQVSGTPKSASLKVSTLLQSCKNVHHQTFEFLLSLKVINLSGEPINLFWIDESSNELVNQFERPLRNGSESTINSYENHRFLVRFFVERDNLEKLFTKTSDDEVVLVSSDPLSNELNVRQTSQYYEMEDKISAAVDHCIDLEGDEFTRCITDGIFEEMSHLHAEKALVKKYRDAISLKLRNYTCADPLMDTTQPVDQYDFPFQGKTYKVNVMLDLSHSKIWAVENFVSDDECKIFMDYGRPRLRRATVAAEDGTSIVSENRKAQQASYNLHQKDFDKDPLW
jgi:hypothetical protein